MAVGMVCAELVANTDQKPVHHVSAQPAASVGPEIGNTNAQAAEVQVDEDDIDAFFNNYAENHNAGGQKEEKTDAAPVVPEVAEEPLETPVENVMVNQTPVVETPPKDDANDLYF